MLEVLHHAVEVPGLFGRSLLLLEVNASGAIALTFMSADAFCPPKKSMSSFIDL